MTEIILSPYLFIILVAFGINVPLGYIRENTPKFSFFWLFWIHASIPLLIYLRFSLHTTSGFIPITIFFAVLGQIVGSCYRLKRMTLQDKERLEQIDNLNILPEQKSAIPDEEVMAVLLNMGGPKTNDDVPNFLRRIFNDPIIIRFPLSFLFQPFFSWLLVAIRGKEAQKRYQLIGGSSPIFNSTHLQAQALQKELQKRGRNLEVIFSFNYSEPFPEETIREIKAKGKKYILPVSLYSHYSKATTGSNMVYLRRSAQKKFPELNFLDCPNYYLHDGFISAFVDRIYEQLQDGESLDDFYLIFSAHGLPLYFLTEGDPYPFQVAQTVAKVLEKLRRDYDWTISYQSAVGPLQWLKPSTESVIEALIHRNKRKIFVIPISFVTDHIETLCEIDIEYRQFAKLKGAENFRMSKAIETHPGFITALADSIETILPRNLLSKSPMDNILNRMLKL